MATPEILTPDVEVLDLDEQISTALVKRNITDAVINELKSRYGGIKLRDVNDKETYLEVKEARKEVRFWGIETEKACKKGREEAIAIQKKWLAKEKEILGKIAEVQDPLDAEIKKYDDEQERIEQENQRKKEELFINRQSSLFRMGAAFANGCYNLGEISYESNLVKEADQSMWQDVILPKYTKVYERVQAEIVEQERIRREQEEKLKKEREELEQQQRLFKEQQEAFQKQQSELENQKREAQQKLEEEMRLQKRERLDNRLNQLRSLGMIFSFQYDAYVYEDVNVDNKTEINLLNDTEWSALITKITPVIEQRKADAAKKEEEKKLQDIEDAKQKAIQQEQERVAEELRLENIRKEQEKQKQAEELAKASDKVRFNHFLAQLNGLIAPEFKSNIYKGKWAIVKEKIEEINSL